MPLFKGGYCVRHSVLHDSSLLGRLDRHADWRTDLDLPLVRGATRRSSHHLECGSGWRVCVRSCAARIRQPATLGGNRRDRTRAVADSVAIHLWLRGSWHASVLAFHSWRNRRAAWRPGALAGLEAERQGTSSAWPIARSDTDLRTPTGVVLPKIEGQPSLTAEEYGSCATTAYTTSHHGLRRSTTSWYQPSSVAPQPAALRQSANRTWPFAYFLARKSHSSAKSNMSAGGGSYANTRFPKRKRVFGKSITKIKAYITTLWSFRMDRSCSFTTCVRVST